MMFQKDIETLPRKKIEEIETDAEPDNETESKNEIIPVISSATKQDISLIRIPDGVIQLTSEFLADSSLSVILVIPGTVEMIDEQIQEGRTLTIVSERGGAAEAFAEKHGIRFLVSQTFALNY